MGESLTEQDRVGETQSSATGATGAAGKESARTARPVRQMSLRLPDVAADEKYAVLPSGVKSPGSTRGLRPIRVRWRTGEARGIPSVEVKFVDIGKNTGGEGGELARF